uniref:Uncharacterized protein n=1 Tax=Globisporangium ultimum (strain ATCC 200006 / CBS 805.95 / DAOM BR144) TaxID=431595 RepID=K3WBM0_GLOUD
MKWVLLSSTGKFHKRLIVISAFRMWMLKRKKPFKTQLVCCKELQLMHIQKIKVLSGTSSSSAAAPMTSIQLTVSQSQFRHPPVVLHFDPGVHTEGFVRLLQRLMHGLRLVFPDKQFPKVHLPSKCLWEEFFAPSDSDQEDQSALVEAMTAAYRAFCDDLNVRYRPTITTRLIECVGSSVDFQYCLSFPPGVDGYQQQPSFIRQHLGLSSPVVNTSIQLREVQALARTLEHCHCFDGMAVYDLSMNEIGMSALFQALLSPHSSINAFTLTNVDLSARSLRILQNVVLQSTIKRAKKKQSLQLKHLDFSFNKFSPAMAVELSIMLELLPSGLEILQLEQCRLSSPSSSRILRSVKTNTAFSSCLRQLNLSGNQLGHEGSRILSSWITGAFALHCLDLSQTKLSMNVFFHALRQNSILHESSLRVIDLSYNRMRTQASKDLGWILGKTQSLSTLFLRGMQRQSFHPRTLVTQSLARLAKQASVTAHIGHSHPTKGLKKTYLKSILTPMFQNTGRALPCLIDLSENDLRGRKAALLAELIDVSPFASRASLRLDHTCLYDKSSILLLHALRGCRTLDSLSLEGNGYIKRETQISLARFHEKRPLASNDTTNLPSAIEQAAASAFALILGGVSSSTTGGANESRQSASGLHSGPTKVLPLKELCLKSESSMIFGAHVITAAVQALTLNHTLQVLDVSGNECGDILARQLGSALRINKSLQVLFWDNNFTTVDGFFYFYDGLVQNQTLVMVQMPIKDTRRILEEQKDPPREKLFSILGKIFKVTERNQTTVRTAKAHRSRQSRRHSSQPDKTRRRSMTAVKEEQLRGNQRDSIAQVATPKSIRASVESPEQESAALSAVTHEANNEQAQCDPAISNAVEEKDNKCGSEDEHDLNDEAVSSQPGEALSEPGSTSDWASQTDELALSINNEVLEPI